MADYKELARHAEFKAEKTADVALVYAILALAQAIKDKG